LSTPRTDEKDIRFLKLSHQVGEPVHFYDRFYLRDVLGKYISGFREHAVFPGSIFSEDPTFHEYFPILAYVHPTVRRPTQFYLQNVNNRPDSGIASGGAEVRLVATDDGLGSYNVLGAWKDSRDCYYFNDYMEGDNGKKETWIISKADPPTLRFGDKVFLQNKYWDGQRLAPDSLYHDYVTTNEGDTYWTIEPIMEEIPGPDSITLGNEYYLRHVKTGKYVTKVEKGSQWYPTLGSGDRVKLKITGELDSPTFVGGMSLGLVSTKEDLLYSGKRCDVLMAWDNPYLYYYYSDYSRDYQTWIISLVTGSGLVKSGSPLRLINKGYGQFMAPTGSYLTTVSEYSTDCDWVLEGGNAFSAPSKPDRLTAGQGLIAGQSITSADGRFTFTLQTDANLVLYAPGNKPLWASNTSTHKVYPWYIAMQGDGNLVVYDSKGNAYWASNTVGNPGAWVSAQSDGNVVIYKAGGDRIWQTNTVGGQVSPSWPH
jgi:hypothetical protein